MTIIYVANYALQEHFDVLCDDHREIYEAGLEGLAAPQVTAAYKRYTETEIAALHNLVENEILGNCDHRHVSKFHWEIGEWKTPDGLRPNCTHLLYDDADDPDEDDTNVFAIAILVVQKIELE